MAEEALNDFASAVNRPNGSEWGEDKLFFAVVLSQPQTITLYSNGAVVGTFTGSAGLTYGSSTSLNPGDQVMQVGSQYASGGRCINSACQDDIYNYNPQHVGLPGNTKTPCWAPYGQGYAQVSDDTVVGVTLKDLEPDSSCYVLAGEQAIMISQSSISVIATYNL